MLWGESGGREKEGTREEENGRERQFLDSSCQIFCRGTLWLNPAKSQKEMDHVNVVHTDQASTIKIRMEKGGKYI